MRKTPPLNWLRAFEAAARLGGFSAAATDLGVTASAISQHVRALETHLGKALFERSANGVTPTAAGQRYATDLGNALVLVEEATTRLVRGGLRDVLVIHVPTSFASQWIVPRLDLFRARHPEIDLRLTALDRGSGKVDAEIRYKAKNSGEPSHVFMLSEEICPVCAPARAATLRSPHDLRPDELLHVPGYIETWDQWFSHAGIQGISTSEGTSFDQSIMAIRAAVEGKGVLLGRSALVERELKAGLLVAPFDVSLSSEGAYWWFSTPDKINSRKVKAFRDWLLEVINPQTGNGAAEAARPVPPGAGS